MSKNKPHTFMVPGDPKGKGRPRFSRHGGFIRTYTDSQTLSKEAEIKWCFQKSKGPKIGEGPVFLCVKVYKTIPASFSKKRHLQAIEGTIRPTTKPDVDNYAKIIADALNGLAWHDDAQIVSLKVEKFYAESPRLVVGYGEELELDS